MIKAPIDTNTVALIGLDGISKLWDQDRSRVYTDARRGRYGNPDWRVAVTAKRPRGVPVWLADRFGDPGDVDTTPYPGELPPLLGIEDIAVCMGMQRHTVEVMRGRGRKDVKAPEPYAVIGQTPVWWPDPWVEFARATYRPFYLDRLAEHRARLAAEA